MSTIIRSTLNAASSVAQVTELFRLSARPLPDAPDGLTDAEAAPAAQGRVDTPTLTARVVNGVKEQLHRGAPLTLDAIPGVIDALKHVNSEGLNDRLFLLEDVMCLMSRLPPGDLQNKLEDATIGLLYNDLPHPPVNFLPASIPLADYQAAQDPEAARRPKTGLGTVYKPSTSSAAAGTGGTNGADAGSWGADPNANGRSSTTAPPESSDLLSPSSGGRPPTNIPAFPTPPSPLSSRFGYRPGATTPTTVDESAPSSVPASMRTSIYYDSPINGSVFPPPTSITQQQDTTCELETKKYSTQFRTPTGAGNNPHMPLLGASNMPYARSVPSLQPIPPSSLPDPGIVFDALLRRIPPPPGDSTVEGQGHGQEHPSGISTLMFAFATLIIHTLFRTSPGPDKNLNLTSSYLDLSVLYGCNEKEMDSVRRKDGTGRIWEDTWADSRLLAMVPAVGALMVVFSRNHNYLATKLLEINENRTYAHPSGPLPCTNNPPTPPKNPTPENPYTPVFPTLFSKQKVEDQDDDIFNRARLINCAFFMNVILGDYLSAILGTYRESSTWCLDPLEEIRHGGKTKVERAQGNAVSVEFNLLYRWHATLSPKDDDWLQNTLRKNLPADHPAQKNTDYEWTKLDYGKASANAIGRHGTDPRGWSFGGLQRQPDGTFKSNELAHILQEATHTTACGFGPRGIPAVLKPVEVMSIEQARKWGVCTLNEFRQFMGLKKFESFEEWCGVGDVAETAQRLYGHIDRLELYVGMQAEQAKPPRPGAGLCPGYTISRAILADAVCLTRGDRFLTTDLTPFNLTAWGFQDCARDVKNGSMGGPMCKLLFRTLPEYYPSGSIYAHFPFITPKEIKKHLQRIGTLGRYKTPPPSTEPIPHGQSVNTFKGVQRVLGDMRTFKTVYSETTEYLTDGYGFFLAFDQPNKHSAARRLMGSALWKDGRMEEWSRKYELQARELIEARRWVLAGVGRGGLGGTAYVDVVRDVLNVVPVHWVCKEIAGIPLKTTKNPKGIHTEQQVYKMISAVFTFIFLNINPENSWALRDGAKQSSDLLQKYIKANIEKLKSGVWSFGGLFDSFIHTLSGQRDDSDRFLRGLLDEAPRDMGIDQLTYNVFGLAVASVANWAMAATHVINFYLDDERAEQKKDIECLAMDRSPEAAKRLAGYAREALRFDPQAPGIFRDAAQDVVVEEGRGRRPVSIKKGERIFVSLAHANMDPDAFKDPHTIDPTRPREAYSTFGRGEHSCLGDVFTEQTIPAVMRAIFSKHNVRRAPGQSGQLNRFRHNLYGTETWTYLSAKGTLSPWPASLVIQYDL